MNISKPSGTFYSKVIKKALLLIVLLLVSTPSAGNDGRDVSKVFKYKDLWLFPSLNHYVVTYRRYVTSSPYTGDVVVLDKSNSNYKIAEIGDLAFKGCTELTSVTMGNDVIYIDSCSFQNCTGLKKVFFKSTLMSIGEGAFDNCSSLPSLELCLGLKTIGKRAFRGCTSLSSVTIPNSVNEICEEAFSGCTKLDTVVIGHGCENLSLGNNVFVGCESLKVIDCKSLVPPRVEHGPVLTPEQMEQVKVMVLPSALETYRKAPFWKDIKHLEARQHDIVLGDSYYKITSSDEVSVTYKDTTYNSYAGNYTDDVLVSAYGFQKYHGRSVPDYIYYEGKRYNVTSIGENAFRDCTGLDMIDLKNNNYIKRIEENAFKGCINIKILTLPHHLEYIGSNAFQGINISTVNFPASLETIDSCAFNSCSHLKTIVINNSMQIGPKAFEGTSLQGDSNGIGIYCYAITPPVLADSSVFDSNHYANSVVQVRHISLPSYCESEQWGRFANFKYSAYDFVYDDVYYLATGEDEVSITHDDLSLFGSYRGTYEIPEAVSFNGNSYRVTRVDDNAFYFCSDVNVTLPNTVKSIGDFAFAKNLNLTIKLGDSLESIGVGAFNNSDFRSIIIPKSVKFIGDSAFWGTNELHRIIVDEDNPVFDSRDNCYSLIETSTNRLIAGGGDCRVIPSTVTSITDGAFMAKSGLIEITIPGSVQRIGAQSFAGCSDLKKVTLGDSIKCIGANAFVFTGIESIVIPNSVVEIEGSAFQTEKLKKVTLGSGLKTIGEYAFAAPFGAVSSMDTVICYASIPPEMKSPACFAGSYDRATLFVPEKSIELYKNDPCWSQFFNIDVLANSAVEDIKMDEMTMTGGRYNLLGQPVPDSYKGIVIENGKKIIVR